MVANRHESDARKASTDKREVHKPVITTAGGMMIKKPTDDREDARSKLRDRNRLWGYDRPSIGRNGMAVAGYEPSEVEVDEFMKARNDD